MAFAADLARLTESIGREIANGFVVTIQSRRDQRQEFGGGFLSSTFDRNPASCCSVNWRPAEIGQQARGAPGKMPGMEPSGRPAVRTGPDFRGTEVPKRCVRIFTNLLGGAQKMADDRMNTGDASHASTLQAGCSFPSSYKVHVRDGVNLPDLSGVLPVEPLRL